MPLRTKRQIAVFTMFVVCSALFLSHNAWSAPQPGAPGDFGLGAMFGAPTGLSAKYWYTNQAAIDGGLAWHFGGDQRFQIHADSLWHITMPNVSVPDGKLPFYVGAGLRVLTGDHPEAGIRIPLGLSYLFNNAPVEIFAEIVPVIEFAPDTNGELDGAIGVRYYFKTH